MHYTPKYLLTTIEYLLGITSNYFALVSHTDVKFRYFQMLIFIHFRVKISIASQKHNANAQAH